MRGELALVAGLQLAVGDAADAALIPALVEPASGAVLIVVEDANAVRQRCCAGAGGQQQEAEGEAGYTWASRRSWATMSMKA